jgi:DHA1 family bicyclomycin/chloramphenicol resistance-like MFS transporter
MKNRSITLTIILLGLLTAIVPFSIDMYLPGFTDIAATYKTSVSKVALSLSSFFIGMGIGQLMYGPLLDRFGRKTPLYVGLSLYIITTIGCVFAPSIEVLIALRFVQAIGGCSATIAATAMVRDFFPPEENAKVFSYLILVLSVSPMLAPTAGSFLTTSFGWRSIFLLLAVLIILISLGVIFFLRDSKGPDRTYSLNPSSILKNYKGVLKEKYFIVYALICSLTFAGLFTYIASSPGIFMQQYGLTQKQYGLLFAFLASGLIIASQVNTVLLKRFRSEDIIRTAFFAQVLVMIIFLSLIVLHINTLASTIGLLFLFLTAAGLVMPNATALAMKPFDHNAGSASALLGFIQMGLGSAATIVIGFLNIQSVLPMVLCMMGGSLAALFILYASKGRFFNRYQNIREAA